MENNIFKGAKFGDKFLTRNGRISLYCGTCLNNHHYVLIDGETACLSVLSNGSCVNNTFDSSDDIVSRYHESIDEDKLDELAEEIMDKMTTLCQFDKEFNRGNRCVFKTGFKAGYRKAMEE